MTPEQILKISINNAISGFLFNEGDIEFVQEILEELIEEYKEEIKLQQEMIEIENDM